VIFLQSSLLFLLYSSLGIYGPFSYAYVSFYVLQQIIITRHVAYCSSLSMLVCSHYGLPFRWQVYKLLYTTVTETTSVVHAFNLTVRNSDVLFSLCISDDILMFSNSWKEGIVLSLY